MSENKFMRMAIELSKESVANGGGPFGAVIVRDDQVIATGSNSVTLLNDPTAHAEVSAIRAACQAVGDFNLKGCVIYSSCEPCPMCLSAIYWAGIERIYYANNREDAAAIGFDDAFIYDQIPLAPTKRTIPSLPLMRAEGLEAFKMWTAKEDKVEY
ncbi:MAG: nucleoside deaminase [Tidjanibacter sp.]|nr:nucleoside deaminase [Tidjanibacter sp.]